MLKIFCISGIYGFYPFLSLPKSTTIINHQYFKMPMSQIIHQFFCNIPTYELLSNMFYCWSLVETFQGIHILLIYLCFFDRKYVQPSNRNANKTAQICSLLLGMHLLFIHLDNNREEDFNGEQ